jgi:hypothetical protein
MNPITVHLTDIEAQAIIQFVEMGIRSQGGQAARIGLPIQDKVALATDVAEKANAKKSQPAPANAGGEPTQP